MKLKDLIYQIENISLRLPNVNTFHAGDVYYLNETPDVKYATVVATQDTHRVDVEEQMIYYHFNLFFVDLQTHDGSNKIDIQTNGIEVLTSIIEHLGILTDGETTIKVFEERFSSLCAGAYADVTFALPYTVCDLHDFEETTTTTEDPVPPTPKTYYYIEYLTTDNKPLSIDYTEWSEIPEDVVNPYFSGWRRLKFENENVTLPDYAFDGCTNLEIIAIGNLAEGHSYEAPVYVQTLPNRCFNACKNLHRVNIKNVNTLGLFVFADSGVNYIKVFGNVKMPKCTDYTFKDMLTDGKISIEDGTDEYYNHWLSKLPQGWTKDNN